MTGAAAVAGVKANHDHLNADLPRWDDSGLNVDLYYWYMGAHAMKGDERWQTALREALRPTQNVVDDCRRGSWEPVSRWASEGGRVYVTAMAILALEAPYR